MKYFILIVFAFIYSRANAQYFRNETSRDVFNSAGIVNEFGGFSLGETFIASSNSLKNIFSEGFLQPKVFGTRWSDTKDIGVYPNPFFDIINVDIRNANVSVIVLYTLLGQEIGRFLPTTRVINRLSLLASGNYFLTFYSNENTIIKTVKLLKL